MRTVGRSSFMAVMKASPGMRHFLYRLGRLLYCMARGEAANVIAGNGEKWLQRQVLRIFAAEPKLVVLDVGANRGLWSATFLQGLLADDQAFKPGALALHMFEPTPKYLADIRANVKHQHASIALWNLAVSDKKGTVDFFIHSEDGQVNSLVTDPVTQATQRMIRTETVTLDDFSGAQGWERVHFIKVDTEGHDFSVIKGASTLFRDERISVLQFEYNFRWVFNRSYLKDVFDFFAGTNYRIGRLGSFGIEIFPAWHFELERFFEGNYIVMHQSVATRLPTRTFDFDGMNAPCPTTAKATLV